MSTVSLTPQQAAIVNHNTGPALVFAVAGAGKTTAMEHRIARLVREGVFPAKRILASAFNRGAAQELQRRLGRWPGCQDVHCSTLHALGYSMVRSAYSKGLLSWLGPQLFGGNSNVMGAGDEILHQAIALARQRKVDFADDLENLDRADFLSYVGAAKGKLAYADLKKADLPPLAHGVASQAVRPAPKDLYWYLDLYRLFEEVRIDRGWLTFDDMLMTGWEMLVRHEEVRHEFQQRFACVMVDEFQDVNLAQSEMLDVLTTPPTPNQARNFMAIGDDDQTIYEWRGAETTFILGFEKRYSATVYYMTENFRCRASHVALANQVITHNMQRQPKIMELTRGFEGATHIVPTVSAARMGQEIARQVLQGRKQGQKLLDMVVLVRTFAQTAPIEQALITAQISYEIVGDQPFYDRPEVQTLINYCRLAFLEGLLQGGQRLTSEQSARFHECWNSVYWQPKRYLRRDVARGIAEYVTRTGTPLSSAIRIHATELRPSLAEKLEELADDIAWLSQTLPGGAEANRTAVTVLRELETRLDYQNYLANNSGFEETGRARAQTVAAFIAYAEGKGNLHDFLRHIQELSQQAAAMQQRTATKGDDQDRLIITSIHRAKGREWHTVMIPGCNQGIIPSEQSGLEEERRLLYVAITRAQQQLFLYYEAPLPPSRFLEEARHDFTLNAVGLLKKAIESPPHQWTAQDAALMTLYGRKLGIQTYVLRWWHGADTARSAMAYCVVRCHALAEVRNIGALLDLDESHLAEWRALLGTGTEPEPGHWSSIQAAVERILLSEANKIRRAQAEAEKKRLAEEAAARRAEQATQSKRSPTRWQRGDLVIHDLFGVGRVVSVPQNVETPEVWVRFKRGGLQRLPLDCAELQEDIPF